MQWFGCEWWRRRGRVLKRNLNRLWLVRVNFVVSVTDEAMSEATNNAMTNAHSFKCQRQKSMTTVLGIVLWLLSCIVFDVAIPCSSLEIQRDQTLRPFAHTHRLQHYWGWG